MVDYNRYRLAQRAWSIQSNSRGGSHEECDESLNIRSCLGQSVDSPRYEINSLKNQILTDGMQVSKYILYNNIIVTCAYS